MIPLPTLMASLVGKAAACGLPGDPSRHLRDLALLCALVDDPLVVARQLTAKDRARLRAAHLLDQREQEAWRLVPDGLRNDGWFAWQILTQPLR